MCHLNSISRAAFEAYQKHFQLSVAAQPPKKTDLIAVGRAAARFTRATNCSP